jgi:hypothetical protein
MDFHRVNLAWCASVAFVAGALACSAQTPSAQSSILSKPADDGIANHANGLQLPEESAPASSFSGFGGGRDPSFPMPTPDANAASEKELNDRKNWTLMTPEEIMGLQTPEEIFGLSEQDPDKKLSPEERFLKREEKATSTTATNGIAGDNIFLQKDLGLIDRPDANDPLSPDNKKDNAGGTGDFSGVFGSSQDSLFGQKTHASQFGAGPGPSAAAEAKAKLEATAEMDRFRALIGEIPQPGSSALTTLTPSALSPSLQPISQFDAFGHQLASEVSDPSKPSGLSPLTEFSGFYPTPAKTKRPAWEAKAPPWLSDGVTPPNGPPVRKFY